MFDFLTRRLHYSYFLRDKQKNFLEDLRALVSDGVPLNQAINTICKVSDGITERVAIHIAHCIAQGKQLADGMQGWFARSLVEVIRSGEESGNLTKTLNAATYSISQQINTMKSFLGLMVYPVLILVAAFLMMIFIRHSVLDNFAAIRPIAEWPNIGKSLYRIEFLVERWWWLVIVMIVFIISLASRLLQQLTGKIRTSIDELPVICLYRDMTAAHFMETLGLLISNGVVLKKALSIMHREAVPYLSWHILKMEFMLNGGSKKSVADVLDTKLISRKDIIRLRAIAKSKGFEYALISLGRQASQRTVKSVMLAGKVSSGLLLLLSALMAIAMVFGIYAVGSAMAI